MRSSLSYTRMATRSSPRVLSVPRVFVLVGAIVSFAELDCTGD